MCIHDACNEVHTCITVTHLSKTEWLFSWHCKVSSRGTYITSSLLTTTFLLLPASLWVDVSLGTIRLGSCITQMLKNCIILTAHVYIHVYVTEIQQCIMSMHHSQPCMILTIKLGSTRNADRKTIKWLCSWALKDVREPNYWSCVQAICSNNITCLMLKCIYHKAH